MPYITCPDGKTYSRYDQSEYVKKCMCEEKAEQEKKFQECMKDPKCKKEYEHQQFIAKSFLITGVSLITIMLLVLIVGMLKSLRNL